MTGFPHIAQASPLRAAHDPPESGPPTTQAVLPQNQNHVEGEELMKQ